MDNEHEQSLELMLVGQEEEQEEWIDPSDSPFKIVVDPAMRARLKQALVALIDNHDASLAEYVSEGQLELDSYKEYVELFARCLRETMETQEGVQYLMRSVGFDVGLDDINTNPQWRWKGV